MMDEKNLELGAIFSRRSVRAYTDEAVSEDKIQTLVKAALAAPSGMNRQPWRIIVLTNRDIIMEMDEAVRNRLVEIDVTSADRIKSRGNRIFYNATTVIFIAIEKNSIADAGIAAENISIAATALGLGSVILGLPNAVFTNAATGEYWKNKLGFEPGFDYGLAVAVGYAANDGQPHELDFSKVSYIK